MKKNLHRQTQHHSQTRHSQKQQKNTTQYQHKSNTQPKRQRKKKNTPSQSPTSNWSSLMATLSAAILAVGSIFTVFITYSTWRHVQETSRPYFSLVESPKITELNDQSLSIHLVNAGDHPAEALKSKITMTLAETGEDIYKYDNHLLSTTPKNSEAHLLIDLSEWADGGETPFVHELYMTLWLSYYDPLLQKTFNQDFHLKWNGLIDGHYEEMTYMTQKEMQELRSKVKLPQNR